jgi:FkbM family methyltransferase
MKKPDLPVAAPKPPPAGYRIIESSTARGEFFDTERAEYLTWLLAPAGRDFMSDHLAMKGSYEYDQVVLAMQLLPLHGTFVDVGASMGPWALVIAKARPDVTVEAFEPEWLLFHQLAGNIFLNNLTNVHAHRAALGAREGTGKLHLIDPKNHATASLLPGAGRAMATVPVVAFDDLLIRPAVMKLDVEGSEHDVLIGGLATLKAEQPIVFFESWDPSVRGGECRQRRAELFAFIEIQLGYEIRQISGENFVAHPPARREEVKAALGLG